MNLIGLVFMQAGGQGSIWSLLFPMLLIFAIMYFLIFRPQARRQKQHQMLVSKLKKGDRVVTAGGIYGTIAGVKEKEKTFIVKIDDNVKVEIAQASIARILETENGGEKNN